MPDDYQSNMLAMLDIAGANGIAVVLGGLTPANGIPWRPEVDPARWLSKLGAWLEQTAQERCLAFADYHAALADDQGRLPAQFTRDGVHLTRPGYARMRPVAMAAIDRALAQGTVKP
ncbi:GDSL-type esterase/lipase family protein [Novosphingobium sp.]|uniref:GDSL-type esterase/lipase family protein n=1 Tax=Novosphingobium sp. TaxID=1874826 RepID=UPI003B521BA8